jgi:DNA-binding FadR family transcriptional regulator
VNIHHGDGIYINDYLKSGNLELLRAMFSNDDLPHKDEIEGLLLVRRFLAPEMTKIAVEKANEEDLLLLESIINNDIMPIEEIDIEVHNFIARTSGVLVYIFILNFFNKLIRDKSNLFFSTKSNNSISKKFHKDLLNCFYKEDSESAAQLMTQVLLKVEKIIFENYNNSSQ